MVRIHNTETDEIIDREMNDVEYAQHLENLEEKAIADAEAEAKAIAKAALLDRLGITAEEAALLLS
jgi:hypothetical protein